MGEIVVLSLTYGDRRKSEETEQGNCGPLKGFPLIHPRIFCDPTVSSTQKMKLPGSCQSLVTVRIHGATFHKPVFIVRAFQTHGYVVYLSFGSP
jgi:hypothetical protein